MTIDPAVQYMRGSDDRVAEAHTAWICFRPNGEPYLPSMRASYDEAMQARFGPKVSSIGAIDWWQRHLDDGWTCREISLDLNKDAPQSDTGHLPRWLHVKSNTTYVEVGRRVTGCSLGQGRHLHWQGVWAELSNAVVERELVVFYRSDIDNKLWGLSAREFDDGRFVRVGTPQKEVAKGGKDLEARVEAMRVAYSNGVMSYWSDSTMGHQNKDGAHLAGIRAVVDVGIDHTSKLREALIALRANAVLFNSEGDAVWRAIRDQVDEALALSESSSTGDQDLEKMRQQRDKARADRDALLKAAGHRTGPLDMHGHRESILRNVGKIGSYQTQAREAQSMLAESLAEIEWLKANAEKAVEARARDGDTRPREPDAPDGGDRCVEAAKRVAEIVRDYIPFEDSHRYPAMSDLRLLLPDIEAIAAFRRTTPRDGGTMPLDWHAPTEDDKAQWAVWAHGGLIRWIDGAWHSLMLTGKPRARPLQWEVTEVARVAGFDEARDRARLATEHGEG